MYIDNLTCTIIALSLTTCCLSPALMLAIALSIWGGDAANQRLYINMLPVGIAVTSVVLSLSAGIFATLELFNVWTGDDLFVVNSNKIASAKN